MNCQSVSALVPMKGNSERVPNKNTRMLYGKPACYWILEALSESEYINEIIINTDSDQIKELVQVFEKVVVIDRPAYLLGDAVSIQPLIEHDLHYAKNQHILQTHSTNPLLPSKTINRAIETYFDHLETNDTLFSVTPIQQRFYFKNGLAVNHNPEKLIQTQLLEPLYHENSCMYIFSKESNNKTSNRIGQNPYFFEMNHLEAADIDEWHDFLWAEFLLSQSVKSKQ